MVWSALLPFWHGLSGALPIPSFTLIYIRLIERSREVYFLWWWFIKLVKKRYLKYQNRPPPVPTSPTTTPHYPCSSKPPTQNRSPRSLPPSPAKAHRTRSTLPHSTPQTETPHSKCREYKIWRGQRCRNKSPWSRRWQRIGLLNEGDRTPCSDPCWTASR